MKKMHIEIECMEISRTAQFFKAVYLNKLCVQLSHVYIEALKQVKKYKISWNKDVMTGYNLQFAVNHFPFSFRGLCGASSFFCYMPLTSR